MENLIDLDDQSEAAIAQTLHERFQQNKNYTRASDVLVAVNSFTKPTDTVEADLINENSSPNKNSHVYGVARNALSAIVNKTSLAETIVFNGESGSGKSYNVFQVLKFLTSQQNSKIETKHANAIQIVLKSFGCAKTLKNDEATRYGISLDLLYQRSHLSGIQLKYTTPLEVSRVVTQKHGERNFNIFYEIYHGLNDDAKSTFGIRELQKFFYINQGNQTDNIQTDEDNFDELDNALNVLGFTEDHRLSIYKIISTVLHLGNVYYRTKRNMSTDSEIVEIANSTELKWVSFLLEINYDQLVDALLQRTDSNTSISLDNALDNRDSFAMLLYEELFKWILSRINVQFKSPQHTATISIIDNYGFERYNNNGLEEFLINCVNERIENLFVKHTFHEQLVDYLKDGVNVNYTVPNSIENGKVVELLFKKPYGLLSLLTDECKFPKGNNESYLEHCNLNHMDRSSYGKSKSKDRLEFTVRHCIGSTCYSVSNFFRKNKRSVNGKIIKVLCESRNAIITMLFRTLDVKKNSDLFISQAQLVMKGVQEIIEKIDNTHTQFVRCIRSNNERTPMKFDIPMVNRQIKTLLLSEVLHFRSRGYPIRIPKRVFARQYRCLLPGDIAMCQNEKEIILDILQGQGVKYENDYKIGNDYVFLRECLADRYESQQFKICHDAAIIIQKNMKSYVAQKQFEKKKKSVIILQAGLRGWKTRRDYVIRREELLKALGRSTKQNKRLEAYHQALEGDIPEKFQPSTLVGYIDIDNNAKKILERPPSDNNNEATYIVNSYLTTPLKMYLPNMKSISLQQYADENFKGHLLEPRREPIMTPFLHKESEHDFRLSVEIFKLVLKFMNDRKLTRNQRDGLGRYIVHQGILNPCQRDEILVQAINQLYNNKDKQAVELGWKLVQMAISVYPPTENIIPMLIGVFNEQSNPLKDQLFTTLQQRLKIYDSEISRDLPPSNLELLSHPAASNTVAEIECYDGLAYDLHLNPWITANEAAEQILRQRGVGVSLGWTVEVETPNRVYAPAGTHFLHDVFSEIDGVEGDEKIFFNFPPEKLVKPKPKPQSQSPIPPPTPRATTPREYPTPEEWINRPPKAITPIQRPSSGKNTPIDRPPSIQRMSEERPASQKMLTRVSSPITPESSDESIPRQFDEIAEYSYTLPNKKKPVNDEQESMREVVDTIASPILPRKIYSRNEQVAEEYQPMNFAPPPTFNYPMMQYVPMMIPQPMAMGQPIMMQPQMIIQPQYAYTPQFPQIPQYPAPPPQDMLSPQSVRSFQHFEYPSPYDSMRSPPMTITSPQQQQPPRTLRRGEVPSQYSTIRNMPVPEHSRDVDQFLDAVFDQVLSKDDHQRIDDFNAHQMAGAIKGGRGRNLNYQLSPRHQQQQYDYYPPQDYHQSPVRSRAQSLPRHVSPRFERRKSYSEESTSSDEHMDYRERTLPRYNSNGAGYPTDKPIIMMMPMQVNPNGEMILLSPTGTDYRSPSRTRTSDRTRKPRGVEKYMARRSPSVDGYSNRPPMIRRTPDGIERIQMQTQSPIGRQYESTLRREPRSRERMDAPMITRQIPPRIDYHYQNGKSPLNYRSPSPVQADRRGLNRLPVDSYVEPIVKSTTNNSEYLEPNRFDLHEQKAVIRAEKEKSRDAYNKLNNQLKKLPPPIDNVRLIRGKSPANSTPSPAPSESIIVQPSPPAQATPQPQREEWSVERAPETQERIKGSFIKEPALPVQRPQIVVEKPAVKYVKAPWKLTIRKEMFYPGEVLNDIQIIDQVFAQIVGDCKKSYPYRISLQDRQQVEEVLRVNSVPPSDLNDQTKIHPDVKVQIIEKARRWPLYFNQIYEVVEKRPDESIGILLAISEHGIRLVIHTPHDIEHPLKVQDFFPFETIVDVSLEANDILAFHVKHENEHNAYTTIRVKTNQAIQIKKTLEKCINGGAVQKRRLVRALDDYVTNEHNHLSFKKGDVIELLPSPEGEFPPSGDWLYGRIENRFGYLLLQYIDSNYSDNVQPLRFENNNNDEEVHLFDDEVPFSSERYTMLDFASKYFRGPKEQKKQRLEDWTWGEIAQAIKFTDKPISQSLLKDLEPEESKHATETFQAILKFMGDEPLKKSESVTDMVFKILIICHRHPNLRDEVYCQLIKQTTSNISTKPDSAIRGWRLFTIFSSYFPSTLTLKPYLLQYLSENADNQQRLYHGTAKICQYNIFQTFKYGGRKVLLNALEVQQTTDGNSIRRQPFFIARDNNVMENLKTVTVAEEMIQELCNLMNVKSLSEQQEFSLCYTIGKDNKLQYCKNDDYIMDIITEMEHKKLSFQFFLKRTVWVHPMRFDNVAYIDSMFDQVIDDYLRGSIISTNAFGQLTATTTEEIIRLGAYLFMLLPDNAKGLTTKQLPQIVPRSVIEPKHRHQEEMINRINKHLKSFARKLTPAQLKAEFLELLSTWPLFGVSNYKLKSVFEEGLQLPEVILSIGKSGVQLLQPKSQQTFKQWNYNQIKLVESKKKASFKSVRLVTDVNGEERTLDIKTDEADEIAHLIGQYIYVVNDRLEKSSTEL
ncbi:unnamed protein product [Caenorhabditis angaria]|uniref:Uncharacterized protein n=1 Tax=Caenorhabditis angaria TaxID=860376 RepID=A0A9P1J0Y8_9PELO|nr:unnamed protein product [Caenorhabditis angaria]